MLGGILAVLGDFGRGLYDVVKTTAEFLFDIVKTVIQFVFTELPRPFRILMVILLLVLVGSLLHNFTLGATKVCLLDENSGQSRVADFGVKNGILFKLNLAGTDLREYYERISTYEVKESDEIDAQLRNDANIIEQSFAYEVEREAESTGDLITVVFGLTQVADAIDLQTQQGAAYRKDIPQKEVFDNYFGNQYAIYDICSNQKTYLFQADPVYPDTCLLKRRQLGSSGTDLGLYKCDPLAGLQGDDEWQHYEGEIMYWYENPLTDEQSSILSVSVKLNRPFGSAKCNIDSGLEDLFSTQLTGTGETVNAWRTVSFSYDSGIFGERDFTGVLYGVYDAPLRVIDQNAILDAQEITYSFAQDALQEFMNDVSFDDADTELLGVLTYECNDETEEDLFDVKTKVLGVDPFDPVVIALLFAIGLVFAYYGKWNLFK